jgi:hypothetical protein
MSRLIDLTGQTFGYLTVIGRASNTNDGHARWECRCVCGRVVVKWASSLRAGRTHVCTKGRVHQGCVYAGCDARDPFAFGLCEEHFYRLRRGEPILVELPPVRCARPGCETMTYARAPRGLCGRHYQWWLRSNKAPTLSEGVEHFETDIPLSDFVRFNPDDYMYHRNERRREAIRVRIAARGA